MISQKPKYYKVQKVVGSDLNIYQLRIVEIDAVITVEINKEDGKRIQQLETIQFNSSKSVKEIVEDVRTYIQSISELKMTLKNKGAISFNARL